MDYTLLGKTLKQKLSTKFSGGRMADFKLTYATMFNPPEALHQGFDNAVAHLKANLGKEYGMIIEIGRASCRERVYSSV